MKEKPDTKDIIRSVVRTFKLLDIISKNGKIGVTELSKLSDIPKTTVVRILNTLKEINVVAQDSVTKQYYLWLPIYEMGRRVLDNFNIYESIRPFVKKFVLRENVDALVGVLDNAHVMYVDKYESESIYSIVVDIGTRIPLLAAASGISILAYQTPEYRRKIFENSREFWLDPNKEPTFDYFEDVMTETRENGYFIDKSYHKPGVCAVGVPIFNLDKEVKHSITFPQFISEIDPNELKLFANRAKHLSYFLYEEIEKEYTAQTSRETRL